MKVLQSTPANISSLLSPEVVEVMREPQADKGEVAVVAPLTTLASPQFDIEAFTRDMITSQRKYFLALAMGYSPVKAGDFSGTTYNGRRQWFQHHPEWYDKEIYIRSYWQELAPQAFFLWTNDYRVEMFEALRKIALEGTGKEQERALEFYFRMFPTQNPYKVKDTGFEELMIRARRSMPS